MVQLISRIMNMYGDEVKAGGEDLLVAGMCTMKDALHYAILNFIQKKQMMYFPLCDLT